MNPAVNVFCREIKNYNSLSSLTFPFLLGCVLIAVVVTFDFLLSVNCCALMVTFAVVRLLLFSQRCCVSLETNNNLLRNWAVCFTLVLLQSANKLHTTDTEKAAEIMENSAVAVKNKPLSEQHVGNLSNILTQVGRINYNGSEGAASYRKASGLTWQQLNQIAVASPLRCFSWALSWKHPIAVSVKYGSHSISLLQYWWGIRKHVPRKNCQSSLC